MATIHFLCFLCLLINFIKSTCCFGDNMTSASLSIDVRSPIDRSQKVELYFVRNGPRSYTADTRRPLETSKGTNTTGYLLKATYTPSSLPGTEGWNLLEIHGNPDCPDEDLAELAGFAEGYLLGEKIYYEFHNYIDINGTGYCNKETPYCINLNKFIDENKAFMKKMIAENPNSDFWHMISLHLCQLQGLEEGYNSVEGVTAMQKNGFFLLQIAADLDDLEAAWKAKVEERKSHLDPTMRSGKCSGLIKLLPDNSELFVSHDTWDTYYAMLRVFKLYDLPYKRNVNSDKVIPGRKISLPSYPGKLQSEDDFYMISSNLVTLETTNGMYNNNLYNNLTPKCVMEGFRAMAANRLASNGKDWVQTFSMYNSGTYNNQWMVVDYNLFEKGQSLPQSDILWVLEQLPGLIVFGDQTEVLKTQNYWASYNVPFYSTVYELSGYKEQAEKFGSWFTHWGCPRAQMFKRSQDTVKDMNSLVKLMRYNDYEHDPLSYQCGMPPYSAENAISARGDLNPPNGTYFIPALGHRNHGGIDNKATSSKFLKEFQVMATAGPTHDQQPVFKWSTSGFSPLPLGQPDAFDFKPIVIKWSE